MLPYFNGNKYKEPGMIATLVTTEGADAIHKAIEYLENKKSVPLILESKGLKNAARDHCFDIGKHGLVSHVGSDGSRMSDRINRYGTWYNSIAENVSFSETTAKEIVLNFIIDDGNIQRGHRITLLNPQLKYLGISCGPHSDLQSCCVIDFAGDYEELGSSKFIEKTWKKEFLSNPSELTLSNQTIVDSVKSRDDKSEKKSQVDMEFPSKIVSCRTKKTTTQEGNKRIVLVEKTYTMEDGTTKHIEETEETYE